MSASLQAPERLATLTAGPSSVLEVILKALEDGALALDRDDLAGALHEAHRLAAMSEQLVERLSAMVAVEQAGLARKREEW